MVELVNNGVTCHNRFRERQMQKIVNNVLNFTEITMATLQPNNHLRRCRSKWNRVCNIREQDNVMIGDEDKQRDYLLVR
jgi:hypothetical protein